LVFYSICTIFAAEKEKKYGIYKGDNDNKEPFRKVAEGGRRTQEE
jgi:hypothetical protein